MYAQIEKKKINKKISSALSNGIKINQRKNRSCPYESKSTENGIDRCEQANYRINNVALTKGQLVSKQPKAIQRVWANNNHITTLALLNTYLQSQDPAIEEVSVNDFDNMTEDDLNNAIFNWNADITDMEGKDKDWVTDQIAENIIETEEEEVSPTIVYDHEHGKLHFGGNPTEIKSKWSKNSSQAQELMEAEIKKHEKTMMKGSDDEGTTTWYIGRFHTGNVGKYKHGSGSRNTNQFTIQVVVNKKDNRIDYHGYPDERLVKEGVGKTKNTIA
ncbi:hypothetical protein ABF162_09350 [Vibrio coralliilyticus]|uniref:hypothetical protein n=1 Tax=Vibrio coralliilyticus TaxID=190893 RepID=UPI0005128DCB|nr:hypothetical protein [Vibrio coralliilyticus]AIU67180.1 hypothetical protein JV59_33305 [Vibrio coralliilyticus]